ncbi:hypothetical protein AAFF_G00191050 [Aldrovandia affinis]|uniref:Uncharacterized protein n=1 Tax=Aldrovandia affinis TaxID=143900 RepID=A0AAD7W6J4_9TELE|nr:hypothetical protein AAFF_G00191050 [Aldrovandia affinis]
MALFEGPGLLRGICPGTSGSRPLPAPSSWRPDSVARKKSASERRGGADGPAACAARPCRVGTGPRSLEAHPEWIPGNDSAGRGAGKSCKGRATDS